MALELYKTLKGLTDTVLRPIGDDGQPGNPLVLPTAQGGVLNPGIEITQIESTSRLGEAVFVDTYSMGRKPTVQLTWQQKSIELIAMRLGLKMEEQSNITVKVVSSGLRVLKNEYAGSTVGFEGFGMPADQATSVASLLLDGAISVPLTRQPFATFNPATPLSFAQGADGAHKWSDDLIGKYVSFEFEQDLATAISLTEENFVQFQMTLQTIFTDRTILEWQFPNVSVKLDEGDINLRDPELPLTFQIQDDGSTCLPYSVAYKGKLQARTCLG